MEDKKYMDFYVKMQSQIDEMKNLFLTKNEKQYADKNINPLINFETGAKLTQEDFELPGMYKTAFGYMLKHLSYVSTSNIKSNKVDESLMDIAIYSLIMRYMVLKYKE